MKRGFDIQVYNEGSVIGFRGTSVEGLEWLRDNLELEPWQYLASVPYVDARMADDILAGMQSDGLRIFA